jgi:hypothetical protein
VDVAQLLDALAFGADIEIVIACLPEGVTAAEVTRDGLLECLHCCCERFPLGFGHEEMDMLRHDDVPEDTEFVMLACLFEGALTAIAGLGSAEVRFPTITTEGEEVKVASVLITMEAPRHGWIVGRMGEGVKITLVGDGGGTG